MDNLEPREHTIYQQEITETSESQKIIFDNKKFKEIEKKDFTLSNKYFKQPIISTYLRRQKEEILVISKNEQAIDIRQSVGKTCIPLLNRSMITDEINSLKQNNITYRYVALKATEIIVKACFNEGIDTPIELMIVDERIIEPIEKSIIVQLKGNLMYQKVKFIITPNYSVSLIDSHIDKAYTLYFKLTGIKMPEGAKVMSIKLKNAYIISTQHRVKTQSKLENITIDRQFKEILTPINKEIDYFRKPDNMKKLDIAVDRINSIKRNSKFRIMENNPKETKEIVSKNNYNQFHIEGKIKETEKLIPILIDTGASINIINKTLVKSKNIKTSESQILRINNNSQKSLGNTEIIIQISTQDILVKFEIQEDDNNKCILGIPWLEQVKPWKIDSNKIIFTHKNVEFIAERLTENCWYLNQKYYGKYII